MVERNSESSAKNAKPDVAQDPKEEYEKAQSAFQSEVTQFWSGAEAKKSKHEKVEGFPPVYDGPPKPPGVDAPKPPSVLPTVNDMTRNWHRLSLLTAGAEGPLNIEQPGEANFKRNYAREVVRVGAQHGLTKEQTRELATRIYAFEDGGVGTADMLSGVSMKLLEKDQPGSTTNLDARRDFRPVSTAIGYNQLLMATTLAFVVGSQKVNEGLETLAKETPDRSSELQAKAQRLHHVQEMVRDAVVDFGKSDPNKFINSDGSPKDAAYVEFAKSLTPTKYGMTGREMASAVQSLNLDGDTGPIIQALQFDDIVSRGLSPSYRELIERKVAADTEKAKVFDGLSDGAKQAAINEVLACVNGEQKDGAIDAATAQKILALKADGETHKLSANARALVDKLFIQEMHNPNATEYLPAAVEMVNLAGPGAADEMLRPNNAGDSTVNYFNRKGYQANPIVGRRSADELFRAIYRGMHGKTASTDNPGMKEMLAAFDEI